MTPRRGVERVAADRAVAEEEGRPPLPDEQIRPEVSNGSVGLLRLGFRLEPGSARFDTLRRRLLELYRHRLAERTLPFRGMPELLEAIEAAGGLWGVVTNKPAWLTDPLLAALGLEARAACVVSGDTVPRRKPHPEPLLHATRAAGTERAVYVGDAPRDIEAARAAGMPAFVAAWGYIEPDESLHTWGADAILDHPLDLLPWIGLEP